MLILDQALGQQYSEICDKSPTHVELVKAEAETLGMTHAEIGALIAEQWKLPPILVTAIGASHDPATVTDPTLKAIALVVHLSGLCADVFVDAQAANAIVQVRSLCASAFKLPEAVCDKLLDEISGKTKEVVSLFEIKVGAASNYEGILERANEALVELTLQSQMQASKLQQQNQVLKKKALIDALTGLINRATFDDALAQHFNASKTAAAPLTLLMIDVDNFKSINDRCGHQVGDLVLANLGKLLRSRRPPQDLAARYGGEELALLLSQTPRRRRRPCRDRSSGHRQEAHGLRNPIRPGDRFHWRRHDGAEWTDDRSLAPAEGRRHGRLRRQAFRPQLRQNILHERRRLTPRPRGKTAPQKPRDGHPAGLEALIILRPRLLQMHVLHSLHLRVVKSRTPRSSITGSLRAFVAVTCCKYNCRASSASSAGRTSGSFTLIWTFVSSSPLTCRMKNPHAGEPPNRDGSGYPFTCSHGSRLVHDPSPPPG